MKDRVATREDLRYAAGQLICFGFEGASVTAELREILREVRPAGLILFARNIESPHQVAELNRELKSLRNGQRLLLCVDQEGGRVSRVHAPATQWPSMRALGTISDPVVTRKVGRAIGRELRAMSFDVNFAPVLDMDAGSQNPVIGDRAFSADPLEVARHGVELARGLSEGGVAPVGKHFPGHGSTDKDSHHDLPVVDRDLGQLREEDWLPFRRAIEAGLEAMMTAHVLVPELDEATPATLSSQVLARLREELGFRGVIISDDLKMRAVADRYSPAEMAVRGLSAGLNLFVTDDRPEAIVDLYRGIVQANECKEISNRVLLDAADRVVAWRDRIWRPPCSLEDLLRWVGCAEHQDLVAEIEMRLTRG